jgi:cell wall-associated NlpC family hydrolase
VGLAVVALALVGSGCAGSGSARSSAPGDRSSGTTAATDHRSLSADEAASRLLAALDSWRGTPHRLGGTTRRGVDCSALTSALYRDAFDLALPRSTRDQVRTGRRVPRSGLQVGDLVFFRPEGKDRHVGVYLGDARFAHASSSQGVHVSSLDRDYWQRWYWTARRLLPPLATSDTTAAPPAPASRSSW